MTYAPYAALLDAMIEAVCLVDATTLRITAVNQGLLALVGMETGDCIGKPIIELTAAPEDLYFWEDVASGLADSILSTSLLRCLDGVAIPVERKVSRVWLSPNEPIYLVGMRDLRQQREAEEQLESRMAELRATLESTGDGILVTDTAGVVLQLPRMDWATAAAPPGCPSTCE